MRTKPCGEALGIVLSEALLQPHLLRSLLFCLIGASCSVKQEVGGEASGPSLVDDQAGEGSTGNGAGTETGGGAGGGGVDDGGTAPSDDGGGGDDGGTETTSTADSGEEADPCGDVSVIPSFSLPAAPALTPVSGRSVHGADNIYAPDVVRVSSSLCLMYYGAQGGDGHDQIFLATSTDCANWVHWPDRDAPAPVVASGTSNHVNDPSVVQVGGTWYMYYTDAPTAEDDRIHLATSSDGFSWTKQGIVLDVGGGGTWDSWKVGRPSVVVREGTFWLYYDGNDGTARHVGLATSADGRTFAKHASNPLVFNAGAMDVEQVAGTWLMLHEGHSGTLALTSADGLTWCDQGQIMGLTGGSWDAYGQVTPFVYTEDGSRFDALLFGGASHSCWCHNRIGQALPVGDTMPTDPDDGCGGCVADSDCTQACRDGGYGVDGFCSAPGSTDPGACCACVGG